MSDLYARLLAELDHARRARGRDEMVAALRAVVELHKPVVFWRPWANEPHRCAVCPDPTIDEEHALWPCSTVQTITRELGVDGG